MLNVLPPIVRVKRKSQHLVALVCYGYRNKKRAELPRAEGVFLQQHSDGSCGRPRVLADLMPDDQFGGGAFWCFADGGRCLLGHERHVDIFKESAAGNAANAVGSFDDIVAGTTGVFAAEGVGEDERLGELTGADEKARAINVPGILIFHGAYTLQEDCFRGLVRVRNSARDCMTE